MSLKVRLFNRALAHLGAQSEISSPTENSPEAHYLRTVFEDSRQALLREHDWSSAIGRRSLVKIRENTEDSCSWKYVYKYPNNVIRVTHIITPDHEHPQIPWQRFYDIETQSQAILTNRDEAVAATVEDVPVDEMQDPVFFNALSWRLAAEVAPNIISDFARAEQIWVQANRVLLKAKEVANEEMHPEPERSASWIQARIPGFDVFGIH